MSKPRSRIADYAVYLLVRTVACIIQALPSQASASLAGGLAWLLYHLDRRHRAVARDNLRQAFPDIAPPQREAMVRATYRHFCAVLVDIARTPRKLNPHNWRAYVKMSDATGRQMAVALLSDRPLLLVTAHFGNWEMGGYVLGLLGFRTYAIARRLDNPYLDRFLMDFRQRQGQTVLDKNDDYDRMLKVLSSGGALATLGDQDAGARGLFVDFFGRPASTHKAVALFALQYQVPMMVIGVPRRGDPLRYEILTTERILPEDYANRPDAVRALTRSFTEALEGLIRRTPEQYFWLHRRWKHQPSAKPRKKVA